MELNTMGKVMVAARIDPLKQRLIGNLDHGGEDMVDMF